MAAAEVVEAVETVEEIVDTVIRVNVVKSFFSQKNTQLGVVGLTALGLGVAIGVKVAQKRMQATYDQALTEEIERSTAFIYEQAGKINKEGDFADPEKLLSTIEREVTEAEVRTDAGLEKAATLKVDYSAMYKGEEDPNPEEQNEFLQAPPAPATEVAEETVVVQRKLFTEPSVDDLDAHDKATQMLIAENLPHVISADDFNENESDFEQVTITWFAGDGVLVDELEKMIDDVEGIVGASNMDRFGYLSGDPNIVYVRNPEKELEFEVVKSEGNYAQEVLGFQHSDETFERRQRRSRMGDDG